VNGLHRKGLDSRTGGQREPSARRIRAEQTQRSARRALRDELTELHQLSLEVMRERGVLPPLYGGRHLGLQQEASIVGLDGARAGEAHRFLGLALQPANAEPNADLALARDLVGYVGRTGSKYARTVPTLYVARDALSPLHGEPDEVIEHMCQARPFAVFPVAKPDPERSHGLRAGRLPVNCRGIVLCAENPAMLEAAIWDYRLCLALEHECRIIADEGAVPAETLPALSVRDLVAHHDLLVVRALRLYGCTSPLRDQQSQLDVLRDDSGDLRAPLPLRPDVEPVELLANERRQRYANAGTLVHLRAEGTPLAAFWPQIRASRYFCIRQMYAQIDPQGWRITGYRERPGFDWLLADDLARLYRLVHLYSLHECLAIAGLIDGGERPGEGFYDALGMAGSSPPLSGEGPGNES
jgi:hypothetical protein